MSILLLADEISSESQVLTTIWKVHYVLDCKNILQTNARDFGRGWWYFVIDERCFDTQKMKQFPVLKTKELERFSEMFNHLACLY